MLVDPRVFPEPDTQLFSPGYWKQTGELRGSATGRGTTHFFTHKGKEFVLRHYHRGGFVSRYVTDGFAYTGLKNTRPWRETGLLLHLQTIGLPAPVPVAAMVTRSGACYRADIITRKIPDSEDLFQILCRENLSEDSWRSVGETIRLFHDNQIFHHDLNIHNLMLDRTQRVWLIDFDRCGRKRGNYWKTKNLERLLRSLHKEKHRQPDFRWNDEDWNILLAGYSSSSRLPPGR